MTPRKIINWQNLRTICVGKKKGRRAREIESERETERESERKRRSSR